MLAPSMPEVVMDGEKPNVQRAVGGKWLAGDDCSTVQFHAARGVPGREGEGFIVPTFPCYMTCQSAPAPTGTRAQGGQGLGFQSSFTGQTQEAHAQKPMGSRQAWRNPGRGTQLHLRVPQTTGLQAKWSSTRPFQLHLIAGSLVMARAQKDGLNTSNQGLR